MEPEGNGSNGILILGESPWKDEIREGKPFAGPAGSYLNRLLRMMALPREQFVITNSVNCQISALGWLDTLDAAPALERCRGYLVDLIKRANPKVILALGNVALRTACGVTGIMSRQAYVHETEWGVPCVPTFHPSFLMRGAHKLFGATAYAFQRAKEIARAGRFNRLATTYLIDRPTPELDSYVKTFGYDKYLAIDIETADSPGQDEEEIDEFANTNIVRVSFSLAPLTAVTVPWSEPYISWLQGEVPKFARLLMWNESFDTPRLIANGVDIRGEVTDVMWAWHFLQSDLPKALGFVAPFFTDLPAWKHTASSDLPLYSAMDADATIRCYIGIREALEKQKRWGAFETHCLHTGGVLKRMGPRGILLDQAKQAQLKTKLETEYAVEVAKLQSLVPESIKRVKVWKKGPKEVTPEHIVETQTCGECGGSGVKAEIPQEAEGKEAQKVLPL